MTNPAPNSSPEKPQTPPVSKDSSSYVPPTPLRCFTGSLMAGSLGIVMYRLTRSIIDVFAHKPLPDSNPTATNIAVAVRTLVVGTSTLATAIFSIAALGLTALGIQLLIKQLRQPSN
ncbi:MAG TPA: DUF3082 domain-containing protein [Trichocoleus sp.]|jgi:hypothetical protein